MLTNRFAYSVFALLMALSFVMVSPSDLRADPPRRWGPDGRPIRQGLHIEWQRASYRNDQGYVLVVWSDCRTGDRDIYGQLLAPDGHAMWAPTGIALARLYQYRQEDPDVVAVNGGWFMGWFDYRTDSTGDVWAQKFDMNGNPVWPTDGDNCGVAVDTDPSAIVQLSLRVADDGNGGGLVAWVDLRRGDDGDVFAQHVDANGMKWPSTLWVTDTLNAQTDLSCDGDGLGNMLLTWQDSRISQADPNVFAAKVTPDRQLPWGNRPVCINPAEQGGQKICRDGAGGCYIAWTDKRNLQGNSPQQDIFAQRLDASGQALWAANGIEICTADCTQSSPRVAPSINGGSQDGLIMVWEDYRVNGTVAEVFGQKVSPTGTAMWQADGLRICGDAGPGNPGTGYNRDGARLTTDLSGGLVCAWEDMRDWDHLLTSEDLYATHITAAGSNMCGSGGVVMAADSGAQNQPLLRVDNGTGAFVVWADTRGGSTSIRYRKLLFASCSTTPDSEMVGGLDGNGTTPKTCAMSLGKVGITWEDTRLGPGGQALFYQIVDTTGHIVMQENGQYVTSNNTNGSQYNQSLPEMCTDGAGGFFVCYEDQRGEVVLIRLSRIGPNGEVMYSDSGNVVWYEPGVTQDQGPAMMTPDGQGGCYIAWSGYTPSFSIDLYVMRMNAQLQRVWAQPVRLTNTGTDDIINGIVSNPDGYCIVAWQSGDLSTYNVSTARIAPDGTVAWNFDVCDAVGDQDNASIVADGQGGAYYAWSDLRNEATSLRDIYAQHLNADSSASWAVNGIPVVIAPQHQNNPVVDMDSNRNLYVIWEDFRSGADLDLYGQKITPQGTLLWPASGKVVCIAGDEQKEAVTHVDWNDGIYAVWTDARHGFPDIYATHFNESGQPADPYWLPDSGGVINNFYQRQDEPTIADDGHGGAMVVWEDYRASGKEPLKNIWGQWVNDFTVSVNPIPNAAIPSKHELAQNYPNPFNPTTEIKFSIPVTEQVEVKIFNTLGQDVATLVNETMPAGSYQLKFEATNLPSGTYFYRLHTPSFQSVRKMVLLK